ncbi:aminoacyl-tRNA hydrolase [Candidatus Gracilibacteria bacterium]|nr:aminoacyl-tRNA hydrolase [Candidatus Gracilibacteria bacterium]
MKIFGYTLKNIFTQRTVGDKHILVEISKPMKIVVGLGNPGKKYTLTRHNVGFLFLDYFQKREIFSDWKYESKFTADISQGSIAGEKILLLKPQTFMNLSGVSLQKVIQFYKLTAEDVIVIYDDKDMDFGKIRIREIGSAGGHNGVKDIIKYLGGEWRRIKIGVGKTPEGYKTSDWVLSKFTEEERIDLDNEIFLKVYKEIQTIFS